MKLSIPPHIAWPTFVVLILLVGIGGAFSALYAAYSDGGVTPVDDYYQKAVNWNETAARRAASAALGWQAGVSVQPPEASPVPRPVAITITDRDGHPVEGLQGTVRAFRPQDVKPVAEAPLQPDPGVAGQYRQALPVSQPGLWDFEVTATRGPDHFHQITRIEVR